VSKSAVETYGLGAAPVSGKGLTAWFEREAIDGGDAVKLGLLGEKEGRRYDRFRGRLMFPIRDIQGRTLGFGGRSGESAAGPKYLNSPESEIYRKSRALYGVYEGRQALREAERAVVVEGYLDVIALHEAGIEAVVASCGTALTVEQARLLKRFSSEVVVLFDGDDAGMAAAARSFPVFVEAGVWAYGAFLPRGEDPDSYVRTHGAAKMLAVIKNAAPLAESYVRRLGSGSGIADSARAAAELASVLKKVSDPFEHDLLVRKAAMWTGVSEQLLRSRGRPERSATPVPVGSGSGGAAGSEELLATVLLADPGLAAQVDEAEALRSMQDATWRDIVARTIEAAPGGKVDAGEMLAGLSKTLRDRVAGRLAEGAVADPSMRQRVLTDCVKSIQAQARRRHNLDLVSKMRKREQLDPDRDLPEELAEWKPREGCDA
jgi:DNA primase